MAQPIPRLSRLQGRAIGYTIDTDRVFTRLVALVFILCAAALERIFPGRGRSPATDRALAKLLGVHEIATADWIRPTGGSADQRTSHDVGHGWRIVQIQGAMGATVALTKDGTTVWDRRIGDHRVATSVSTLHLDAAGWRALDAGVASYVFPVAPAHRTAARAALLRALGAQT